MPEAALAVHETGEGPAVLLLHAFPLDSSAWDHQVAALSDRYRCIRPDMWGCGASPAPPDGAHTLDDYAAAVIAALDARGVGMFAVIGISIGGYTTFALLRVARERLTALVLANTRAGADTDASRRDRLAMADRAEREQDVEFLVEPMLQRLLSAHARAEPHVTDPVIARIRRCTPAAIAFAQRAMAQRPDSSPLLSSIDVPALCVAGEDDAVTPPRVMREMGDAIAGSAFVTLPAGHLSNVEVPHEFSRVSGEFLDSALLQR